MKQPKLFIFLVVLFFCHSAFADDFTENGIAYSTTSSTTVSVAKGGTYDGVTISYSGDITIPASVTHNGTTYSVTAIGREAFKYCGNMTAITIPNSVTSIGEYAFYNSSVSSVKITDLEAWCKVQIFDDWAMPIYHLYLNGTEVKDLEIPASITSILNNAFCGCKYLTSVTIPEGVTSIGETAFQNCRAMVSITIPSSVISIGSYAFYKCEVLSSVKISDLAAWCKISCDYAGSPLLYAHHLYLNGIEVKDYLEIPTGVTSIGASAFRGLGITSVTIPKSVTSIGASAFSESGITSLTIPQSVTSIGEWAFSDCSSLTTANLLMENLESVDNEAFYEMSCTVNVPFGMRDIYESKFDLYMSTVQERAVITISSSGSATYCSPKALDFSAVEELDAYVATSYNNGELTATQRDKVPANTGVLLKGTPGVYVLPEYTGDVSPVATNMFEGINTDAPVDVTTTKDGNEYTNLVLAVVGDELGFYNLTESGMLAGHRAYLPILTSALNVVGGSKKITVNFNTGGATDVKGVELNTQSDDTIYNLQGQKVVNPERGIYIVNGKKTYIK